MNMGHLFIFVIYSLPDNVPSRFILLSNMEMYKPCNDTIKEWFNRNSTKQVHVSGLILYLSLTSGHLHGLTLIVKKKIGSNYTTLKNSYLFWSLKKFSATSSGLQVLF